ncbi:MAG TPA: D-alanyl-D-alanine carboxypeptidase/D-alanyl-D-alanine-endopeptidase [Burkholderiales bacterium]|nr:D-alanyl-D-alanine carboxypeptidase/D-alanyl-D-alanine-endopeptidase [Betaproteobacteria bacterium]HQR53420.1 D-alanyl-D-alanine carboxypeptidase/D-alanyl-D-alanine-endopeptidase [Burkholderiales bacterium]
MKTAALTTLILLCVLALPEFAAAEDAFPLQEAAKAAGLSPDAAGIFVQDPASGRVVYAVGADRELNPASTMKLLTTYAALDMLGPAFTWKTEVWADGTLQGDVLKGNLVIKGSGDPKLTLENLWLMLRGVRNRGLKHVRGDLVLDRSAFQDVDIDPARFDGDPTRAYNVGPDALLVNYKAVRVHLLPDPGSRAVRVILDPPLANVQVENRMTVGGGPCGDWRALIAPHLEDDGKKARLSFRGAVPASCGERSFYLSVLGHAPYTGGVFRYLWEELGGTLSGVVRDGSVGAAGKLLFAWESPTLAEVVRDINKFSNNVMARQLFLTLGAEAMGPPATPEKSSRAIRQWLDQKGLSFPELVLENGSGLSRVERISARHLGEVLTAAYRSPVMPELMASLPVAAVDGTMRKRLRGGGVAGQAHLKTGSLDGVKSVAGYVLDAQGRRMVVVCIVNHVGTNIAAGVLQDALLSWVYQRP